MFRIDRNLVNLSNTLNVQANVDALQEQKAKEGEGKSDTIDLGIAFPQVISPGMASEEELARYTAMADDMVKQAAVEASLKLQIAEMEALEIKNNAWQNGYTEGKEDAKAALEVTRQEDARMVKHVIDELKRERERMYAELEDEVRSLSIAIARKIVHHALDNDDTLYESMIKTALKQAKFAGKCTIRLSNKEYERFFSSGSATFVLGEDSVTATVLGDPALGAGDCIIDSETGTVNAGVDSQLKYIEIAFRQADGQEA